MISIFFSPIVGLNRKLSYKFEGYVLTVTMDDLEDVFDFSDLPDGRLDETTIDTILPIQPIVSAERINDVLYLSVLNNIPDNASEFQKFPEWIEVGEENGEV